MWMPVAAEIAGEQPWAVECIALMVFAALPLLACIGYLIRELVRSCRIAGSPTACEGCDPAPNGWHFDLERSRSAAVQLHGWRNGPGQPDYFDVPPPAFGPKEMP